MSDDESFVARWSRRKRDAAPQTRHQPKSEEAGGGAAPEVSAALPPGETRPPPDPASLPPIESIGAGADIRAFLAAGVPADLARAALRRAWSADPVIRDFIGLSENSWDFNAPGGVPGFGSVKAEDIRRLMGEPETAELARPTAETSSADQATVPVSGSGPAAELAPQQPAVHDSAQDQPKQDHETSGDHRDPTPRGKVRIAMQHQRGEHECCQPSSRRRHGSALPE
jgi:hypothetical protein